MTVFLGFRFTVTKIIESLLLLPMGLYVIPPYPLPYANRQRFGRFNDLVSSPILCFGRSLCTLLVDQHKLPHQVPSQEQSLKKHLIIFFAILFIHLSVDPLGKHLEILLLYKYSRSCNPSMLKTHFHTDAPQQRFELSIVNVEYYRLIWPIQ